MKRRLSGRAVAGGAALALAVVVGVALVPNLRADPPGASPAQLRHIALKNDRAAVESAAVLRDRSRATAEAAEGLRAAEERGRAQADAMLTRFDNSHAGRSEPAPGADQ